MASKSYPDQVIDEMYQLTEEYAAFLARRKANREMLRNMDTLGHLTPEQSAAVEETYPHRLRQDVDAEQIAA